MDLTSPSGQQRGLNRVERRWFISFSDVTTRNVSHTWMPFICSGAELSACILKTSGWLQKKGCSPTKCTSLPLPPSPPPCIFLGWGKVAGWSRNIPAIIKPLLRPGSCGPLVTSDQEANCLTWKTVWVPEGQDMLYCVSDNLCLYTCSGLIEFVVTLN